MDNDNKYIIKLQSQAAVFNLLAQAFNYPDTDLIEGLCRGDFTKVLRDALTNLNLTGFLVAELTDLDKIYSGSDKEKDALLLGMEKDYTHMFFSSKPRLVYLFESVYKEGKLLQDSTFEIARLYYDSGLNLVDDFKLPPDHIAVEFEFMSYLYFNEIEAIKKGNRENEDYAKKLQKDVLEKHLVTFGRAFAEKVRMHAQTAFYKSMARVAILMLAGDKLKSL
jgi:putative dimethyl sulfoxide reductase chaperone